MIIDEYCKENKISKRKLAKQIGISNTFLADINKGANFSEKVFWNFPIELRYKLWKEKILSSQEVKFYRIGGTNENNNTNSSKEQKE